MKLPYSLLLCLQLGNLLVLPRSADAQGFLGHEISMYGKYYDHDNEQSIGASPFLIGAAVVGPRLEFGAFTKHHDDGSTGSTSPIDFDAFTIEIDRSDREGWESTEGNFNGFVFEDTNGTLPDFVAVRIAEAADPHQRILVSPNSIWINNEGRVVGKNSFTRLIVTFADSPPDTKMTLSSSLTGNMILEAPTQLGARYRFEESEDLISFTPIDKDFTAIAPHRAIFIKPATERMHYRLRLLEEPSIPLQTDFEYNAEGWTSESNTSDTLWELGTPNLENLGKAASGTKAWGVNLEGDYQPNAQAILRSPLVDLGKHNNEAALTFRYFIDSPEEVEGGQLWFVDESGEIIHELESHFTGQSHTWVPFRVVLPDSLQNKKFRIEFRFLSNDDDEVGAGWFIDDVIVL